MLESLSDKEFIRYIYVQLLGREPDEKGRRHYLGSLKCKDSCRLQVVKHIIESDEFQQNEINTEDFPFLHNSVYKDHVFGHRIETISPEIMYNKVAEHKVAGSIYRTLIRKNSINYAADLGAYKGFYTLFLNKLVEKFYGFEINPSNIQKLKRNLKVNNFVKKTEIIRKAVYNEKSTVSADINGSQTSIGHGSFSVKTLKLDNYFKNNKSPDIIKMDIEGSEIEALQGMETILSEAKPTIFIEVHLDSVDSQDVTDILQEYDYRLETLTKSKSRVFYKAYN